jgi:RES domain-containing protein
LVTVRRVVSDPRPGLSALAELVDDPADLDELIALRNMTDPVAREAARAIALVPAADRYAGAHAGVVMASFLWLAPSRFSPGTFGVLYAALSLETAVRESAYHAASKLRASGAPADRIPRVAMVMVLEDAGHADQRRSRPGVDAAIYDSTDYRPAQRLGHALRAAGNAGVVYDSVRHPGGTCYGVFRPASVSTVRDEALDLELEWDGAAIGTYTVVTRHYL